MRNNDIFSITDTFSKSKHFSEKKNSGPPVPSRVPTNRCFSTTATGEESCCQQYTLSFSKTQDILPKHLTFGRA